MDINARLRDENEMLREQLRQLSAILVPEEIDAPEGCHLTRSELALFRHLHNGRIASIDTLLSVLTLDGREIEANIIRVHMSRMRRKLSPHGFNIECVWGQGWRLVQPSVEAA